MKLPSHLYLGELGIPDQTGIFTPETEKGAASVARVLGFPDRQAVKTLIFQADAGERVPVMLGGDQSIVSANLKRAEGSRKVRLAAPATVLEITGFVIGSIPRSARSARAFVHSWNVPCWNSLPSVSARASRDTKSFSAPPDCCKLPA